jgi:hypothetical protein
MEFKSNKENNLYTNDEYQGKPTNLKIVFCLSKNHFFGKKSLVLAFTSSLTGNLLLDLMLEKGTMTILFL